RPGPVVLELPEDMLRERAAAADCEMPQRVSRAPIAAEMARFQELLNAAARPLVICGGAAWTPQAGRMLAGFAELHGLPVACAFRRQDAFDNTHAHYAGELGIAANPQLRELAQQSDLVIALASRLGEMTTSGYTLFDVPGFGARDQRKLAHIFPHADELNSVYAAELGIESDAESFLRAARGIAPSSTPARETRLAAAHQSYLAHTYAPRECDAAVRMDEIIKHLRERLPPHSIIACGAGNYTVWPQRHYPFRLPGTQLASTNGSMGYAAPAAIAGKLYRPGATVVSFSGDGCFLMNGQELATAAQYGLNVIFIVINNNAYGTIRMHQQRHYPDRPIATALANPDFAALARAYRAFGAVVTRTEQFADAFENALRASKPALIEIQTEQ
ncbi:MAG: thiamine pyrophosphate-dependent enzyme, partial [Gammaproteobacteria bacterium]